MKNNNGKDTNATLPQKEARGTTDLVTGSVTFVVFILFMTVWMYFSA